MLRIVVGMSLFAAVGGACGANSLSGGTTDPTMDAQPGALGGAGGTVPMPTGGGAGGAGAMVTGGNAGAGAGTGGATAVTPDAAVAPADAGPAVAMQTDYSFEIAPIRKLDLVFSIDNSPSMAPKVAKMNTQLPKLIAALKDPSSGTYPDLRIALIDSDLGTAGAYASGSCGPNDGNGQNPYGDMGNFQMRGAIGCGMKTADSLWIEYSKGAPVNYSGAGDAINNVFACLSTNLGTIGCGEEHTLQAYEFALAAPDLRTGMAASQNSFLRPEAVLGLVFVSDEDDCSAATNDGLFGDKPELRGESASLRCATRGHRCNGQDLSDNGPGYPTYQAFMTGFADCSARIDDACPNPVDDQEATDTSDPTSCSPLRSIKKLAQKIKALKTDPAKVLVAGIFGWPLAGPDGQADFSKAEPYKIDLVPNPNSADTAHPQVFDYWPVCYDPDHRPRSEGTFDRDAWGYGATGGLRHSAFVDEFGDNGLKYSICERDFSAAMTGIGNALAGKMQNLCIPSNAELGKTCTATYLHQAVDPLTNKIIYAADATALPKCPEGATQGTVAKDCYVLTADATRCPGPQSKVGVLRTAAAIAAGPLTYGTKLSIRCE